MGLSVSLDIDFTTELAMYMCQACDLTTGPKYRHVFQTSKLSQLIYSPTIVESIPLVSCIDPSLCSNMRLYHWIAEVPSAKILTLDDSPELDFASLGRCEYG